VNKQDENLEEMSAMSAGAVAGPSGQAPDSNNNDYYISRADFLEELKLREIVQECISEIHKEKTILKQTKLNEELKLRSILKKLIIEAKKDIEDVPHESTAINLLEELLKQVLPNLEIGFKTLTTSSEQRNSFRAHIINAVDTALRTEDINRQGGVAATEEDILNLDESEEIEEVEIKVADDPLSDEDKFIDIEDTPPEEEEDTFGIEGQDETGKAMAKRSFDNIEKNIVETYDVLDDPKDQDVFKEYLITNLKLYFDKWEKELGTVSEPTTDEYEKEKASIETAEVPGEEPEPEALDTDLSL